MRELALFAGAGGGILGGHLLGWRTVCAVEINDHCRRVLMQRQDDGILPPFPIWDDIRTFDGGPWRGIVDVISGGFPCQDISAAGKGAGIDGDRSGLWSEMARIIGEVRPRFVFVENSPLLVRRGLAVVLGDLASMGYDARWCVLGADDVGAPHKRKRIWILGHRNMQRMEVGGGNQTTPSAGRQVCGRSRAGGDGRWIASPETDGAVADANVSGRFRQRQSERREQQGTCRREPDGCGGSWWGFDPAEVGGTGVWGIESRLGRVANGVADRVERLRAIGNGQVSVVAAVAWMLLGGPAARAKAEGGE